jgi:hypothetical protein
VYRPDGGTAATPGGFPIQGPATNDGEIDPQTGQPVNAAPFQGGSAIGVPRPGMVVQPPPPQPGAPGVIFQPGPPPPPDN